jgi:WD40 repeat protein
VTAALPTLDLTIPNEQRIKNDFTFDKRVHLIPEARLLVTIPGSNDQLVLHRMDLLQLDHPIGEVPHPVQFDHQVGEVFRLEWKDERQGLPAHLWWTHFTPDGRAFLAGGDAGPGGEIRLWDVAHGNLVQQFVPPGESGSSGGLLLPDGKQLLTWYSKENHLFLWDVATGRLLQKFTGPSPDPLTVAVAPDGKRFLAGGNDKLIYLYSLESGKELGKLEGHEDKCFGLFSPDGKKILTYSSDKSLRLWDADHGALLYKLEGHSQPCSGVFSADGKQVLSYSADKTVRLWDTSTGRKLRSFDGPTDEVTFASFLPGGIGIIAWGKDRMVRIWEAASGRIVQQIDVGGDLGETPNAALCPDGRRVLLCNYGKTVLLLDLERRKFVEVRRYEISTHVRGFSFSPDGRHAAAGSFRTGVYLWRLPDGK